MTRITVMTLVMAVLVAAATVLASSLALAATITCKAEVECMGTPGRDTLKGSNGEDYIYGLGRTDTLKGLAGNDGLYGGGGSDKLSGGPEGDGVYGGSGNDTLQGGGGLDQYFIGPNWGKDSLVDIATSPSNQMIFHQNDGVAVSDDLTVKLISGEGPEVKNEAGTSTIEWSDSVISGVRSGYGDDTITGNLLANILSGGLGADAVSGLGGDDTILVSDNSGNDSVDCGEDLFGGADEDEVYYDSGDDIAQNCEVKHLTP